MEVQRGRCTADIDGDFVVFLIGMRVNHPLRVRKWLPVAIAMPRMLKVLKQHRELGCLGFEQWLGRTTLVVQYWRDFDSLDRFARDKDLPHLEPWRRFNRAIRASGDVGIWHETFRVRAGEYEAVYGNMPVFGLAAAARHMPAARKGNTAAARIGGEYGGRASSRAVLNPLRPEGALRRLRAADLFRSWSWLCVRLPGNSVSVSGFVEDLRHYSTPNLPGSADLPRSFSNLPRPGRAGPAGTSWVTHRPPHTKPAGPERPA